MTSFLTSARRAVLALGLLTLSPALAAAQPSALAERQPVTTHLSETTSAMTFWVTEADGWHVVTIVQFAVAEEKHTPAYAVVRFSSVLQPGQSQLISVPAALGERWQVLRVERVGDRIEVRRVAGV